MNHWTTTCYDDPTDGGDFFLLLGTAQVASDVVHHQLQGKQVVCILGQLQARHKQHKPGGHTATKSSNTTYDINLFLFSLKTEKLAEGNTMQYSVLLKC